MTRIPLISAAGEGMNERMNDGAKERRRGAALSVTHYVIGNLFLYIRPRNIFTAFYTRVNGGIHLGLISESERVITYFQSA